MTVSITEVSLAISDEIRDIQSSDDVDGLISILRQSLIHTAETVLKMAYAVQRLEELGYDLTEVPRSVKPILGYLRRIAWGQVSPKLFVSCMGSRSLLAKASTLPIPDQELIAENGSVPVMCPEGSDHRMVPFFELSESQIKRVVGHGKLRSLAEQRTFLEEENRKHSQSGFEPPDLGFEIDKKRRRVVFLRNTILTRRELTRLLEDLT